MRFFCIDNLCHLEWLANPSLLTLGHAPLTPNYAHVMHGFLGMALLFSSTKFFHCSMHSRYTYCTSLQSNFAIEVNKIYEYFCFKSCFHV